MNQRYVSDELTHFVGRSLSSSDERYDLLATIVESGTLKSGRGYSVLFNPGERMSSHERILTSAVCFCDIPVPDLSIHMQKYSPFGISFQKSFLANEFGASPVFYVAGSAPVRDISAQLHGHSTRGVLFDSVIDKLHEVLTEYEKRLGVDHPPTPVDPDRYGSQPTTRVEGGKRIVDATANAVYPAPQVNEIMNAKMFLYSHVLSYLKFFDHTLPEDHEDNTYMEREWRVLGNVEFSISDIERLIVPRGYGEKIRLGFPEFGGQVTFV